MNADATVSLAPRFLTGNGDPNTDSCFFVNVLAGERGNLTGFEIASAMNLECTLTMDGQPFEQRLSGNRTLASPGVNIAKAASYPSFGSVTIEEYGILEGLTIAKIVNKAQ